MTVINHKSISGITSITTPAGSDNLFTVHTNNQTERFRITSAGDVGIGTATPGAEFEVRGAGTVAHFKGTGGNCFIGLTDVDAGAGIGYIGSDGGDLLFQTPGSSYSTKLTIKSDGKIGINESNPATLLELSAGTNKNLNVWSSGAYATGITIGSANDAFSAYTPVEFRGSEFYFHNGTEEKLRITSNGIVNIGDTTNNEYLNSTLKVRKDQNSVTRVTIRNENSGSGSAAAFQMGAYGNSWMLQCGSAANDSNAFTIRVDGTSNSNTGTEKLRITTAGKVGIGITNPAEKFQVNGGNIAITGGTAYKIDTHPLVSYASFVLSGGNYACRLGSTGTSTIRHTQIYGGGSHIATFDGVNKRLGIGITNPSEDLEVKGDQTATIYINSGQHDASTAQEATLKLGFNQSHANDSIGYIKLLEAANNSYDGHLIFAVPYNNSGTPATREAFRAKWNGNIGIGDRTSNPDEKLHVHTASGEVVVHVEGATNAALKLSSHNGDSIINFGDASSGSVGQISYDHGTDSLLFKTNGSPNRFKIASDGKLCIDNTDGTLTIGGDNVYNSSKVNLQVGSMSQTSATTEATAIVIHDQNSKRNGTESAGSWVSGIRWMSTQINGGSRYGAFINQDIKYNNFSGGATKMRSDLVFGTRGDAQTGTSDPPLERMRIQHDGKIGIGVNDPKSQLHLYGPSDLRIGSLYGGVALIALQVEYASGYTGTHFMFEITDQASYSFEGSHIVHGTGGSSYGIECTVVRMQASREAGATDSGDTWRNGTVKYNNDSWSHDQVGLNPGAGTLSFTYDDTATTTMSRQKIAFSASGQSVGVWAKLNGVFTWGTTSTNGRIKIKDKDGNVLWDSNP